MTETNVNLAECMKPQLGVGETVYYNVCNGTTKVVPWGAGDWILGTTLFGFLAIFSLLLIVFLLFVWREL